MASEITDICFPKDPEKSQSRAWNHLKEFGRQVLGVPPNGEDPSLGIVVFWNLLAIGAISFISLLVEPPIGSRRDYEIGAALFCVAGATSLLWRLAYVWRANPSNFTGVEWAACAGLALPCLGMVCGAILNGGIFLLSRDSFAVSADYANYTLLLQQRATQKCLDDRRADLEWWTRAIDAPLVYEPDGLEGSIRVSGFRRVVLDHARWLAGEVSVTLETVSITTREDYVIYTTLYVLCGDKTMQISVNDEVADKLYKTRDPADLPELMGDRRDQLTALVNEATDALARLDVQDPIQQAGVLLTPLDFIYNGALYAIEGRLAYLVPVTPAARMAQAFIGLIRYFFIAIVIGEIIKARRDVPARPPVRLESSTADSSRMG